MTGLYVMLWVYSIVAVTAVGGCVWTMCTGLATGRHRRRRASAWRLPYDLLTT